MNRGGGEHIGSRLEEEDAFINRSLEHHLLEQEFNLDEEVFRNYYNIIPCYSGLAMLT